MKLKSTYPNMVIVLTLICAISSLALAVTYGGTKDQIAAIQQQLKMDLITQVLPEFDNDPDSEKVLIEGATLYPGKKDGKLIGVAVQAVSPIGYGGNVSIMAGFDPQGNILGVQVLSHAETPGLGSNMTKPKFLNQFIGKTPTSFTLKVKKDGGDVDALTAATISSRAFSDALSRAWEAYQKGSF